MSDADIAKSAAKYEIRKLNRSRGCLRTATLAKKEYNEIEDDCSRHNFTNSVYLFGMLDLDE